MRTGADEDEVRRVYRELSVSDLRLLRYRSAELWTFGKLSRVVEAFCKNFGYR